jgi:hypothetical protein
VELRDEGVFGKRHATSWCAPDGQFFAQVKGLSGPGGWLDDDQALALGPLGPLFFPIGWRRRRTHRGSARDLDGPGFTKLRPDRPDHSKKEEVEKEEEDHLENGEKGVG